LVCTLLQCWKLSISNGPSWTGTSALIFQTRIFQSGWAQ
jgi:hypothetical protein